MSYDDPALSTDDLADQVAEVLDYFGYIYQLQLLCFLVEKTHHLIIFLYLKTRYSRQSAVMCLGVTAGAYILTLFAVSYFLHTSHSI